MNRRNNSMSAIINKKSLIIGHLIRKVANDNTNPQVSSQTTKPSLPYATVNPRFTSAPRG